ncbi:caspase family protein [Bradyrhizobium sp. 24]|uniref:caspase family protein n=1 Tax=unclassified Bradyrhizobium TaxID=2631580 RepID=UPI001FFB74F0|nr:MULTISPECIES: caspase family protein [unclassified Bradyrhizobium]MCK1297520.1 caspase family protein [Bradyrhizobium sp. 37]MCK1381173.1 caspase family protein [Bradyrhizobium sp. 24]MCK1770924.1 caspase family protein [Bradyrhizobium sp. 134]
MRRDQLFRIFAIGLGLTIASAANALESRQPSNGARAARDAKVIPPVPAPSSTSRITAQAAKVFADIKPADFQIVLDDPTSIEIGIPKIIVGSRQRTKRGSLWSSADRALQIETLDFTDAEGLEALHKRLVAVPGRVLDQNYTVPLDRDMFALHGFDRDGTLFHVEFHKRGTTIRGFSISYADAKLWPTVTRVMSTFVPFPNDEVFDAKPCEGFSRPAVTPSISLTLSTQAGAVGEALTLTWELDKLVTKPPSYLIVVLPDAVRVKGAGFFALSSKAKLNPTGVQFGHDQTRLIVPLHTAFSSRSGRMDIIPYMAGSFPIRWAVVNGGACQTLVASGSLDGVQIRPGAPRLVINDEFSQRIGGKLIRPSQGPFELRQYRGWFEVVEAESRALVLRRQGDNPTFSPTGRFLIVDSAERETYYVFDLVANRSLGSYTASELLWSHGDSFLFVQGSRAGLLTLVKTLHGTGSDPDEPLPSNEVGRAAEDQDYDAKPQPDSMDISSSSCLYCQARDDARLFLSLDQGIVVVRGRWSDPQDLVYDLGGKNNRKKFGGNEQGLLELGNEFGHVVPILDGWNVGERLRSALTAGRLLNDEVEIDMRQRMLTTGTLAALPNSSGGKESGTQVVRRRSPEIPDFAGTVRSNGSIQLLDAVSIRALRAPRDSNALGGLQKQLAKLYSPKIAKFGRHSFNQGGTQPLPDPTGRPDNDGQVAQIDLTEPGRDLWYWQNANATYWLTQTVTTGRSGHNFEFSMVAKGLGNVTRYSDLISDANDASHPEAVKASSDDTREGEFERFELGDLRTNPEGGFGQSSQVSLADGRYLVLLTRPIATAIVFDLASWKIVCGISKPKDGANTKSLLLHNPTQHLTQINQDGSIHIYRCSDRREVLTGAVLQDEIILMDENGYFDCSEDAGSYVEVRVPGVPGRHLLSQFSSVLKRKNLAKDVLQGAKLDPPQGLHRPPVLRLESSASMNRMSASSEVGLAYVQSYEDGRPGTKLPLSGHSAVFDLPAVPDGVGVVTVSLVDQTGIASAPLNVAQKPRSQSESTLYALSIGIDQYPFLPAICGNDGRQSCNLKNAASDARSIAKVLKTSAKYKAIEVQTLLDGEAKSDSILRQLERILINVGPRDTVLISISGHAVISGEKLLILLSSTVPDKFAMERTSLRFDAVAERLRQSKARVVVLLDVCHAGLAGHLGAATSEEAAREFLTKNGASMIVLSASRGSQLSEERSDVGGGLFSKTFERVISVGRSEYDLDHNGWISIGELYRGLKSDVSAITSGRQIPMLYRNLLVGDIDLF